MDHPCLDEGPENNRIGCTKFNEGCTKHSKVGINPQSHPYGFQNEIMYHPCSDGGPRNNKIGCTKFCEECTKGFKVRSNVRIGPQSLPYRFQNEITDHPCSDGGPESNRIGCTEFNKEYTKFCERCTKGSKVCAKVGINPQSLLYGFQNEKIGRAHV